MLQQYFRAQNQLYYYESIDGLRKLIICLNTELILIGWKIGIKTEIDFENNVYEISCTGILNQMKTIQLNVF